MEKSNEENDDACSLEEHFYDFRQSRLVKIEYPGNVKNIDNAMKTIGGLANLTEAVVEKKVPLELRFHPKNLYNKPCTSDKDDNVGILLKVKASNENSEKLSYEVLGATTVNFKFNKICDFQYLPLTEKKTEEDGPTVEYVYNKICMKQVPTMEWFTNKDTAALPIFSLAPIFSKYDTPHPQTGLRSGDIFASFVRPDSTYNWDRKTKQNPERDKSVLIYNYVLNFLKTDLNSIPQEPHPKAMEKVQSTRYLRAWYDIVARLFDDRPIWVKQGVMHTTKLTSDQIRFVLPAVAYFCNAGPWKSCWIKLGYNPTKDPNSRIYQVLDFRLRRDGSQNVMVNAKRSRWFNKNTLNPGKSMGEKGFLLKPGFLPPARQMCYQYCDILLPEVQEMITKLPKLSQTAQYDIKNGWLPLSFTEHCREIVSAYIKSNIHEEFIKIEQRKRLQGQPGTSKDGEDQSDENIFLQSSRTLSNISRGVYQRPKFDPMTMKGSKSVIDLDTESTLDDRPSDIDDPEADEITDYLEAIDEHLSDDSDSDSDIEVDLEALEEINQLIGNT